MSESNEGLGWFGKTWVAGVVLYAFVRAAVVWPTLGEYGVSPIVFLLIDVGTAWPYAYAQVRIVQCARSRHWSAVQGWSLVALVSFVAPYAYIIGAGSGELPVFAYVIIAVLVVALGGASVLRILRSVRRPDPSPAAAGSR